MHCPTCQHENSEGAAFCDECGSRLSLRCPECGAELRVGAKFCSTCGTRLVASAAPPAASAPPAPAPQLSASFAGGRYQVKRFLGEGGKKKVYLVHDTLLDRDVAFSLIKTQGLDEVGVERIQREARLMGRLGDHPHVVSLYDIGAEAGQPFLVSQLMGGGDVEGLIERAPEHRPALEQTYAIADQVLQALAYAHEHGIIHRDLKPGNVWLTQDGTAKLGDFGLAMAIDKTRLSLAGMIVGTVGYMPPEQALGRTPDARSDLYSLGAMLYEMVTGRPPFLGDDPVSIISQHINTAPVAPTWHNPALPKPLESLILRLLEKDPGQRPASANEVRAALAEIARAGAARTSSEQSAAQPSGTNPLDRLAGGIFVGRERELGQLRAAFDSALSGRAQVVVLAGEPGIGKTRLAEELATYASLRGAQVLWGRSYEWEGAPAYWSWVQMIRDYVHVRDPQLLRSELGSGAEEIARIVSEVRERVPGLVEAPQLDGEQARFRLFDSLATFLKNATTAQPLVLVFDDLHWADKSSLLLLQFVVRELRNARLLVLGTYRDTEVGRKHPLGQTLAELVREPHTQRLALHGLTRAEVARYVMLTTAHDPAERLVDAVYSETEGNAFFVSEVVRLLASEGRLEGSRGENWSEVLPQGVRDVVGRRLDRLSEETNAVLSTAAVIGRDFSLALLERVSERPADELLDLLEGAAQARVIRADGVARWRFSQELVQETLYNELGAGQRLRAHGRVAQAIEELYAADLAPHYVALAHHFRVAAPLGYIDRAITYAVKAAERATAQFAWETAIAQYQHALQQLEMVQPPDDRRRCELLLTLGDVVWQSGDANTARATFDRALTVARSVSSPELVTQAIYMYTGSEATFGFYELDARATGLLDEALDAVGSGDTPMRANLFCRAALFLPDGPDARDKRLAHTDQALAIARRLGDERLIVEALYTKVVVLVGPQHVQERLDLIERFLPIAERVGNIRAIAGGLQMRAKDLLALGDVAASDAVAATVDQLVQEHPGRVRHPHVTVRRIMRLVMDGQFDQAERFMDRVQAPLQSELTVIHADAYLGEFRFVVHRERGTLAALEADVTRFVEQDVIARHFWLARLALLYYETGRTDLARDVLSDVMTPEFMSIQGTAFPFQFSFPTIALLAEVCAVLHDVERSEPLYDILSPYEHLMVVLTYGIDFYGPVAHYLGLLATTLSRWEDARQHFARALDMTERTGLLPHAARAQFAHGAMLVKRDAPGDREQALDLLNHALAAAEEIGMTRLAEQALALKVQVQGILKA